MANMSGRLLKLTALAALVLGLLLACAPATTLAQPKEDVRQTEACLFSWCFSHMLMHVLVTACPSVCVLSSGLVSLTRSLAGRDDVARPALSLARHRARIWRPRRRDRQYGATGHDRHDN